jgi:hypothetical protein
MNVKKILALFVLFVFVAIAAFAQSFFPTDSTGTVFVSTNADINSRYFLVKFTHRGGNSWDVRFYDVNQKPTVQMLGLGLATARNTLANQNGQFAFSSERYVSFRRTGETSVINYERSTLKL